MYATLALVLIGAIGFGVYFSVNQSKSDSSKNQVTQLAETQTNNNLTNSGTVNNLNLSNLITNTNEITNQNPVIELSNYIRKVNFRKLKYQNGEDIVDGKDADLTIKFGDLDGDNG